MRQTDLAIFRCQLGHYRHREVHDDLLLDLLLALFLLVLHVIPRGLLPIFVFSVSTAGRHGSRRIDGRCRCAGGAVWVVRVCYAPTTGGRRGWPGFVAKLERSAELRLELARAMRCMQQMIYRTHQIITLIPVLVPCFSSHNGRALRLGLDGRPLPGRASCRGGGSG